MRVWRRSAAACVLSFVTVAASGCGSSGGNPAEGVNAALADYIAVQAEYSRSETNLTPATVNQAWLDEKADVLARLRATFNKLRGEAEQVDFPDQAGDRGQPSQATIDEYLSATDAYVAANEQIMLMTQDCIGEGGTVYDCVAQVGAESLIGIYPDVVKRAQAAALQLQSEASNA